MTTTVARAEVAGHSVSYREAGHGAALVLLHGFLCDSRCWRHQLADLSSRFRVIAWDAPGAGLSSDPSDPFTMTDWADCLAAFLNRLAIEQAHIVGLSWGGVLAQEFYRQHARRVRRLILADTYAGWKGSLSAAACEQRLERCERESRLPVEEFTSRWVGEMFTGAASADLLKEMSLIISDFHPLGFRLMATSLAEADTTDLLPTITAPTLVLWGDDDRRSPLSIAEQLRDAIPHARLSVVADAGHVSNMQQPESFNAHVRDFCLSDELSVQQPI
jgi:pimeloyl-ACP methyl ester carboxylesterase